MVGLFDIEGTYNLDNFANNDGEKETNSINKVPSNVCWDRHWPCNCCSRGDKLISASVHACNSIKTLTAESNCQLSHITNHYKLFKLMGSIFVAEQALSMESHRLVTSHYLSNSAEHSTGNGWEQQFTFSRVTLCHTGLCENY